MLRLLTAGHLEIIPISDANMHSEPASSEHGRYRPWGVGSPDYAVQVRSSVGVDSILPHAQGKIINAARPDHNRLLDYGMHAVKIDPAFAKFYSADPSAFEIPYQDPQARDIYTKAFDKNHYQRWLKPVFPEIEQRENAYADLSGGSKIIMSSIANGVNAKSLSNTTISVLTKMLAIPTGGLSEIPAILAKIGTRSGNEAIRHFDGVRAKAAYSDLVEQFQESLNSTKRARDRHIEDLDQEFGVPKRKEIVRTWDHTDAQARVHIRNIKNVDIVEATDIAMQNSIIGKFRSAEATVSGHVLELSRIAERRAATGQRGRAFLKNNGQYNDINYHLNFDYPSSQKNASEEPYWLNH
jgi:hypothetical protein